MTKLSRRMEAINELDRELTRSEKVDNYASTFASMLALLFGISVFFILMVMFL